MLRRSTEYQVTSQASPEHQSNNLLENKTIVEESSENEEDDTVQQESIEEQYAMHLQRGKQIRKELLERLSSGSGGHAVHYHQHQQALSVQ